MESIIASLNSLTTQDCLLPPILKIDSTTDNSVEVVSNPQNAVQSFTTKPEEINGDPLFTVPA